MTTVGVIGTGNMGAALVRGWLGLAGPEVRLVVWDKVRASVERLLGPDSITAAGSLEDLVAAADVIFVVVKPKDGPEVLAAMAPLLRHEQDVVSAMAGVAVEKIRDLVGAAPSVFRIMPNLGVELGVGAVAVVAEPGVDAGRTARVAGLLGTLGVAQTVPETMIDAVTALSGSGPAFLALAIEGLEDGAVAAGSSRPLARTLVRQMALGAARLLSSCSHSVADVTGSLVETAELNEAGIGTLDEGGVRAAFQEAVDAAVNRSRGSGGTHASSR